MSKFKESVIRKLIRRVGHRLNEIVEESTKNVMGDVDSDFLTYKGLEWIISAVLTDVWSYIYESYFGENEILSDSEQDVILSFLYEKFYNTISKVYYNKVNESKLIKSNLIKEGKAKNTFQRLITQTLEHIVDACDRPYNEFPPDVSERACDEAETIEEIKVLDYYPSNLDKESLIIPVKVIYSSIFYNDDFDKVMANIAFIMDRKLGVNIILKVQETENINANTEW